MRTKRKRALTFFWIAACGALARAPATPPANHGGTDATALAHELRLDADRLPHDYAIDPVAPIDLVVTSKTTGAEVLVDGEVVGITPARVRVTAGHHVVRVYAEGY